MRAVVFQGERSVSVDNVPDPELSGDDAVLLRVDRTAICGSDLHLYHGAMGVPGTRLGHEFIGTITEIGKDVHTVGVGDRVLVSGVIGCGKCRACIARDPILCMNRGTRVFGTQPDFAGGQAEAVCVPAADASVLPIPEAVTDESAVLLTDILPTAFLGAQRANIRAGSTVLVVGLGPVGMLTVKCAQLFSPARILAADPVAERRERAAALGAEPIDPAGAGTVAAVMEATKGWGADAVVEAVGADQTISDAVMSAAPGATVSIIGVNTGIAMPFPMVFALLKSLTVRVTLAAIPLTWDSLVPLVASGKLVPDDVFSHSMGLSEAAEAYRLFDAHEAFKVLLDPTS
jgi:2-desacetyl-2-hydroxyethyl bacteriochlorophyllide A dehydrogenase